MSGLPDLLAALSGSAAAAPQALDSQRHHGAENSGRSASSWTTFDSAGTGVFSPNGAFHFGMAFAQKPAFFYGVECTGELAGADAPLSSGFVSGWVIDHDGNYTGAYLTANVSEAPRTITLTHHFTFNGVAVKTLTSSTSASAPGTNVTQLPSNAVVEAANDVQVPSKSDLQGQINDPLAALITEDSDTTAGDMPTSAQMGDLWLNSPDAYVCTTPYLAGGAIANWTKVTVGTTLALIKTHVLALFAADAASTTATVALAAANGKNKITGSTRTPTAADLGVDGDTWEYYVAGKISAKYTYASGAWVSHTLRDEMIDTLTVGKVVGLNAAFLDATIDYLTSVSITSSTLQTANSGPRVAIGLTNESYSSALDAVTFFGQSAYDSYPGAIRTNYWLSTASSELVIYPPAYTAGVGTAYIALQGLSPNGNPPFAEINGGNGSVSLRGPAQATSTFTVLGTLNANSGLTAQGDVSGAHLRSTGSATTTNAANTNMDSGGYLHQVVGSSRTLKHSIEIAELEDDLDALERCGVFAYRYYSDPAARPMLGFVIENMLAEGLRRYVDFNDDGTPAQPAWHQINALLVAAHQRSTERWRATSARLDETTALLVETYQALIEVRTRLTALEATPCP